MNFPFPCPGCGHANYAEFSHIGQQVLCGWCGKPVTVPAPMETIGGDSESGLPIRFACPACGRNFASKPSLAGQKIRCNRCGAGVRVPAGSSAPVGGVPRVVLNANSGSDEGMARPAEVAVWAVPDDGEGENDHVSLREQLASVGGLKRRKSAAVELPSRAETMEQVRQEVAEKEAALTQKKAEKEKKAKKKKRKKTGYFDLKETLTLVGGVSVVVGVLGFLAWRFPEFQFPLGGLLAVIGFFLYFLGAMSLRQIAGNEGFFKLMLYRFCPPYQLWFVLRRWEETQDFVAFFASGLIIMAIGGGVVKISPTMRKANANQREYNKAVDEAVYGKFEPARLPAAKPAAAPDVKRE